MKLQLLTEKIRLALQKRTGSAQTKKCYATWAAKGHLKEPLVSVIIQSHNKSVQVCHILPKLREFKGGVEIIVIDDGSTPEHTERLAAELTGANEFLVRCNDLYENITYDKCLRFCNGRYVALLQDDDDFDGTAWMDRAVQLFQEHEDMVILGGKDGLAIAFEHDRKWAHGGEHETVDGSDFCFVTSVNRAPMWINRELFSAHLHHMDYAFTPFQFDDYEVCARAWLSGLKVGWYDAKFRSLSVGGMRLYNGGFIGEQMERNGHRLYELYASHEEELKRLVKSEKMKK